MKIRRESLFIRNPDVAVEVFGDRSLAFHCSEHRLLELNATARDLLARLNGETTVGQVAAEMADTYNQTVETMLLDVQRTLARMAELNIVKRWKENGRRPAV